MSENQPPPGPPQPPGGTPPPPPSGGAPPPPPPPPNQPPYGGQPPGQGGGPGWGAPPPPPPGAPGGYGSPSGPGGPYSVGNAFSYAFEKFKANWGPLVVIAVLLVVASLILQLVFRAILSGMSEVGSNAGLFGAATLASYGFNAISFLVSTVISAALIKAALALTRNQEISVSTAFDGINWGQVVLAAIIVQIATLVGFILCVLPGIVVTFLTWFTTYFVIDRNLTAVDAIKASIDLVRKNLGPMLLLALASIAAFIVGALACGIGLLVAIPVVILAQVYTFRTLTGDPVQAI